MLLVKNRKAYHDYSVLRTLKCGVVLVGSEVKSLKAHHGDLKGSWGYISNGEVFLKGVHIPKWGTSVWNHEEERDRKLLLHKKEIKGLAKDLSLGDGLTLVPLELKVVKGRIKCTLGLCKGKKNYDKRQALKERDIKRSLERLVR